MNLNILLIEDGDDDALIFKRSVKALPVKLTRVPNATKAICQLSKNHSLPNLIVLDMDLVGMSSSEFLDWLENQPTLNTIPVCIYTGAPIMPEALKRRVRAAFLKSAEPEEIRSILQQMSAYIGYAGP